jgi:hypothetical protein
MTPSNVQNFLCLVECKMASSFLTGSVVVSASVTSMSAPMSMPLAAGCPNLALPVPYVTTDPP